MSLTIENRYTLGESCHGSDNSLFTTYKAKDTDEDRDCIIKMLKDEFAALKELAVEFKLYNQHIRMRIRDLTHLAKVLQTSGSDSGQIYMVREYYRGEILDEKLGMADSMLPETKMEIIEGICLGLKTLHDNKTLCYKLAPDDVMITETGDVKILSYGSLYGVAGNTGLISRLNLRANPYIAPEIISGSKRSELTPAVDIYSAGKIAQALKLEVMPNVIAKATNSDPVHRYQTIQEFLDAVKASPADIPAPVKASPVMREEKLKIGEYEKKHSIHAGQKFEFTPEIYVDNNSMLMISAIRKPQSAILNFSTGGVKWTPEEADIGEHTIEIEVCYGSETRVIKYLVNVTAAARREEPQVTIIPEIPATIKSGQTLVCELTVAEPEEYELKFTDLPKFANYEYTNATGKGRLFFRPEDSNAGMHVVAFHIVARQSGSAFTPGYQFSVTVERMPVEKKAGTAQKTQPADKPAGQPKKAETQQKPKPPAPVETKSEPPASSPVEPKVHTKNWIPITAAIIITVILAFSIIYFRPSEYVPSPLSASENVIEKEKVSFEGWLRNTARERVQIALATTGLNDVQMNVILRDLSKECHDKVAFTILENKVDVSIPRIQSLLYEIKNSLKK